MPRTVKYNDVEKTAEEALHPQVAASKTKDQMSSRTTFKVTIPPDCGDLTGVLGLIGNGFNETSRKRLNDFASIGRCIGELTENEVETDPDHPFSDQSFRDRASRYIEEASDILLGFGLSDSLVDEIKDAIFPRAFKAGLEVGELVSRQEYLACVATDKHRMKKLLDANRHRLDAMENNTRRGVARMDQLLAEGHNKLNAAMIAANEGFGSSTEANRSAHRRREAKLAKGQSPSVGSADG